MKIVLILLCCIFFSLNVFGQTKVVSVEAISLSRDDGNGKAGEETEVFGTKDIPIYCTVQLDSTEPATVKMNLVAVKVQGVKAETKVVSVSYKTNGKQSRVNFTGKPDGFWTAGMYRIDIFVNDKPSGSRDFEIQKSAQEIEKEKMQKQSPPSAAQKPKTAKRLRKN
jgi:hypothetical protein